MPVPPSWQTYDIDFVNARILREKDKQCKNPRKLNGILIHDGFEIPKRLVVLADPEGTSDQSNCRVTITSIQKYLDCKKIALFLV